MSASRWSEARSVQAEDGEFPGGLARDSRAAAGGTHLELLVASRDRTGTQLGDQLLEAGGCLCGRQSGHEETI